MLTVSISKELEILVGLLKTGVIQDEEFGFAKDILDNRKGEL